MSYNEYFTRTYKGKKVLLTGHTGFKGAWMLTWLHHLGAIVRGFALTPENEEDLYLLIKGDKFCDSVIEDIRDKGKIRDAVLSFQPDFIFHLAAQPLVRKSYEKPLYTFEVNVGGTANLLQAVKELNGACAVVIITTDKVYENIEQHYAYREDDKLGGFDPYSGSKAAAEIVVNSYRNSFFNPSTFQEHRKAIATARAGNVIGGGDRAEDRIIPDIVRGIERNEAIIVRNPQSVRPWQHVLEPLGGYLLLGGRLHEHPELFSTAWNLGPEQEDILTVRQVVEQAIAAFGKGVVSMPRQDHQPHEATLLQLNIEKAKKELNWHPRLSSSQAIEWTMRWYKSATPKSALEITLGQIREYEQL